MNKILITLYLLIIPTLAIADDENPFIVINNTTVDVPSHTIDEMQALVDLDQSEIADKTATLFQDQKDIRDLLEEISALKKGLAYHLTNLNYAKQAIDAAQINGSN